MTTGTTERKDKRKVVGEEMTDAQIALFMQGSAPRGIDSDYFLLERAYRSLRAHDFARFITLFGAAGRRIDAHNPEGKTLAEIIAGHRKGQPYLDILNAVPG